MRKVVYSCPFVPIEWIAAHRLQPSRISPGAPPSAAGGPAAGFCPYAWAFTRTVGNACTADAVIFTTACDQMRRAWECVVLAAKRPAFLLNLPATWQTPTARQLYLSELMRLSRFLVELGGVRPSDTDLADVMLDYDSRRSALRAARDTMPARQFAEAVAEFHRTGTVQPASGRPAPPNATDFLRIPCLAEESPGGAASHIVCSPRVGGAAMPRPSPEEANSTPAAPPVGIPVALVGGPLLPEHLGLFDLLERAGAAAVLNGTTNGERTMPAAFAPARLRDAPMHALADAYFGCIPDAFRRPNTQLYEWLSHELSARSVRGIVLHCYTWCDTWRIEAQRMKEWSPVPLLLVTSGAENPASGHTASRIEAFVEMLK